MYNKYIYNKLLEIKFALVKGPQSDLSNYEQANFIIESKFFFCERNLNNVH